MTTKSRIIAGILGIMSLILPFSLDYYSVPGYSSFGIDWLPFWVGFFTSSYGTSQAFSGFFTSLHYVDIALIAIAIILLITGIIILIANPKYSRIGGIFLLLGFVVSLGDYIYDEIAYGFFIFIPVGMILALVGGIIGTVAKPEKPKVKKIETDPFEKLQKLKILRDSGLITDQEYDDGKKKILEEMKKD